MNAKSFGGTSSTPAKEQLMKNEKAAREQAETATSAARSTPSQTGGRRQILNSSAAGAAAVLLGFVAAACGDDDDNAPATGGRSGTGGASGTTGGKSGTGGVNQNTGGANAGEGNEPGGAGGGTAGTEGGTSNAGGGAGGEGGVGAGTDADIAPLNALLTAEYNAITAYTAGAGLINDAPDDDPLGELRKVIVDIAVSIQSQHKLHAEALVNEIKALNGAPVEEATVAEKFKAPKALTDNPSISNVLKFAASAERNAAVAYNQVLAGLEDAKLRFVAASIEGDETQHFIVLAALVLGLANPGPELSTSTADKVFPEAFVKTVGDFDGLDNAPANYFD
jgi:hypothetical protein